MLEMLRSDVFSKNPLQEYEEEYRIIWTRAHGLRADLRSVVYGMRFDKLKLGLVKSLLPAGVEEFVVAMNGSELIVKPVEF